MGFNSAFKGLIQVIYIVFKLWILCLRLYCRSDNDCCEAFASYTGWLHDGKTTLSFPFHMKVLIKRLLTFQLNIIF